MTTMAWTFGVVVERVRLRRDIRGRFSSSILRWALAILYGGIACFFAAHVGWNPDPSFVAVVSVAVTTLSAMAMQSARVRQWVVAAMLLWATFAFFKTMQLQGTDWAGPCTISPGAVFR